ncbi:MAG: FeoB-associated Cys-rich membrane protein [Pseudobutyrivibrio sp.]|nr:FeoB-associated Cys-rich membrane protein [Pseudobutyrivibrio sp.]
MGTVIVILILAAIVGAIIRSLVKAHKRGEHPACGGNCSACGGGCSCNR